MNSLKCFFFSLLLIIILQLDGVAFADVESASEGISVQSETTIAIGYQSFSLHGEPNRAAEYRSLTSSPTFDLSFFNTTEKVGYFSLDANYLNDDEYDAEANLSKGSNLRLSLRTEHFVHNLDHIPYDNGISGPADDRVLTGTPLEGSRPDSEFDSSLRAYYTDHNPGADYNLPIDISEVKLRAKLPNYPAHLNLSYWRLEKKGDRQLRFVDENCTGCHMQSKSRNLDRTTDEVKAGIDAHLGYIDLAVEALHREFRDHESIPEDYFGEHDRGRAAGEYEHSEDPDSEVNEFTLRGNTSAAGGLVGSASFTIGERENNSDITSVSPVKAETDYYKTTAGVTYTPNKFWTVNMRYRLFDIDNSNNNFIYEYAGADPSLEVRDAMDYRRAWYETSIRYRPSPKLTLKAELRCEDIERSDTGPPVSHHSTTTGVDIDPYWDLPKHETITRAKIGFSSRLMEKSALKLSGWATYRHDNDPAYGTSFADSGELFLSTSYSSSAFWGMATSLNILEEKNHDRTVFLFGGDPVTEFIHDLDRDRQQQNFSVGSWFIPANGLSFDMNYGYLHTKIRQDLLLGSQPNTVTEDDYTIEDDNVDYKQTVHTLSAGMTWQIKDSLTWRFEGYHIRSKASYDPEFAPMVKSNGALVTSSDLSNISEIDIRQNGIKGRLNWQIDQNWQGTFEATFDDYDDMGSNVFDGSVTSYMASLSRIW